MEMTLNKPLLAAASGKARMSASLHKSGDLPVRMKTVPFEEKGASRSERILCCVLMGKEEHAMDSLCPFVSFLFMEKE